MLRKPEIFSAGELYKDGVLDLILGVTTFSNKILKSGLDLIEINVTT